jgi:phosphotransferase system IIB component
VAAATSSADVAALARAFGGKANLASVDVFSTRLSLTVKDPAAVDPGALRAAGFRGSVQVGPLIWHVIVGPDAPGTALELRAS